MTIIGAGYHMATIAGATAKASEFPDLVDHHTTFEEPAIFTHDTVEFLARYMESLAESARRRPHRYTYRDPDELAHWMDRCAKDLRTAAATIRDQPKNRPLEQ
ncbi:hypothetical protein O7627_32540 [Solwaraspora sp. WMMD1047]|uniref:hypothetical protein n=1 Tax=Solwaraspora sp. WMMD1047 TaxID=3016102 RepID=UPI00241659C1|nr:hypothetical protein [Solwaraspora sp. WMMD1047]MDG4834000.1 hypothetical protein [Solwaraspora sp. WMMD1047]